MKWNDMVKLPEGKLQKLLEQISKRQATELSAFVNPILREDIFDILGKYCTVLYFPLEDDENDGCDVSYPVSYDLDNKAHFVFINTAKPIEKQVFTAAHELGHIWDIPKLVWDGEDPGFEQEYPQKQYEEAVVNRFAAELLMPEPHFRDVANPLIKQHVVGNKIRSDHFIQLVGELMNTFCVPSKAVIIRLYETRRITETLCRRFTDDQKNDPKVQAFQAEFEQQLKDYINNRGFTRLGVKTGKKGIKDLPQYIDTVEQMQLFSSEKIQALRDLLEIRPATELTEELDITDENLN